MHTTIETIDPAAAKEMLALNLHNRNPKTAKITQYADDMIAGRWHLNGESIKFSSPDNDGNRRLLDGQNRLHAVVESQVSIQTVVAWDVDPGHQSTMDTGATRSYSDVLRMRGVKNAVAIAAVVRAISVWETAHSFDPKAAQPSMQALDETLSDHPEILEYGSHLSTISKQVGIPLASLGALWWVFFNIDADDCEFFWDRLRSDEGHLQGEPIYALRRFLRNMADSRGTRPTPKYMSAVIIKAWNAYREGGQVQTLGFRPGGANPEAFPKAR